MWKRLLANGGNSSRPFWCTLFRGVPLRSLRTLEANTGSVPHVTEREIRSQLDCGKCSYTVGHASFVLQCPFCERGDKMFLNKTTGSVVCKPCGVRGSWGDFCQWMRSSQSKDPVPVVPRSLMTTSSHKAADIFWSCTNSWDSSSSGITEQAKLAFGIEKLLPASLRKYCVHTVMANFPTPSGRSAEVPCVAFPWFDGNTGKESSVPIRVKLETLTQPVHRQVSLEPKEGSYGLFGWNTVPSDAKEVVMTAGEFDAIAVNQSTEIPAVALPSGATSLPLELLPQLEQFEKIYLWLGNDVQSRQSATQFAKKLDVDRCFLVCASEDSGLFLTALDALNRDMNLKSLVQAAKPFTHKQIFSFQQLRAEVYDELSNANEVAGTKWRRFPHLSTILKGHRPGELSVFTGPTGSGKTTILSELSLDLCQQGVTTLWGSFEIRNVRLAKMMLKQYSGLSLEHHLKQYNYWADKLQQLPLYFMGFYGPVDIHTVLEAMSHAAYVYDIQHVIIDNLQFMSASTYSIGDRYSVQDHAIAEFRRFASHKNIHVSLVIHPRKEDSYSELTTASIFGTAKASQEADNVIILQCLGTSRQKYLQVTKNRFDGTVGKLPLDFHPDSLTLSGCFKTKVTSTDTTAPLPLRNSSTHAPKESFTPELTSAKSLNNATPLPLRNSSIQAKESVVKTTPELISAKTLTNATPLPLRKSSIQTPTTAKESILKTTPKLTSLTNATPPSLQNISSKVPPKLVSGNPVVHFSSARLKTLKSVSSKSTNKPLSSQAALRSSSD